MDGGRGEGGDDAGENGGEEGRLGTLTEERADLFVIVERDDFDD